MLARLDPELLDRLSFPLGGSDQGRRAPLARDAGLPVADKRESQDLCFVAGLGGRAFLRRHGGPRLRRPGAIVDRDGRVLGRHEGQHEFTVGQRRGLDVASSEPLYVLSKDADTRRVTVGPREALAATACASRTPRLHRPAHAVQTVRLRYHAEPLPCTGARDRRRERSSSSWTNRPSRSRPASSACLMHDDCVVGEGTIGDPA